MEHYDSSRGVLRTCYDQIHMAADTASLALSRRPTDIYFSMHFLRASSLQARREMNQARETERPADESWTYGEPEKSTTATIPQNKRPPWNWATDSDATLLRRPCSRLRPRPVGLVNGICPGYLCGPSSYKKSES